ncbi:MAG: SIMPL domain-containing protein [Pseudomonadota bacterium]|jgi:uncharacterized protein YggE
MLKPLSSLAVALAAVALAAAHPAAAEDHLPGPPSLSLSAVGEAEAAPDLASITLGVAAQAPTAAEALAANRARMSAAIAKLKALGVEAKDIRTSDLSLNPQYAYNQGQAPKLTGYQASNTVNATVRDLPRLGALVDAVVAERANEVRGISFSLSDPSKAEDAARLDALKRLARMAELYARATGFHDVKLRRLSEGAAAAPPQPRMLMVTASARVADSTPVEPGQLKVQVTVNAAYDLVN